MDRTAPTLYTGPMEDTRQNAFDDLTPEVVIGAVEAAMDQELTGLITPYPSYINRVYEVETAEKTRLVVKFYRPGRWSTAALLEEHRFTLDCYEREIPVVAPLLLEGGSSLAMAEGYPFAVFPRKGGRLFELHEDQDYLRAGALIARIHQAGAERPARHRIELRPRTSTAGYIEELLRIVPPPLDEEFRDIASRLMTLMTPLFEGLPLQRIHGDCHRGNLLDRPGEGLMVIDFDDMAMGPPVHDLWMLLPGSVSESHREFNLLVEGYEAFHPFDRTSRRLIEPLRAMRIIYFLAWCGRQREDFNFASHFPGWGTPRFWEEEIQDLKNQLEEIQENLE